MKITNITKSNIKMVETRMMELLKQLESEFDVKVRFAGGKFDDISADLKINIKVKETSTGASAEEAEFAKTAPLFGMTKADYKKQFKYAGHTFELVAFNPRAYKKPVKARSLNDGKIYVMPTNAMKFAA